MGMGVLGLNEAPDTYSLETLYRFEHFEVGNPQPRYLVPFCNDGRGNFYCFDTRSEAQKGGVSPVVFWESGIDYSNQEPEASNENLADWIMEVVVEWTLEDYDYNGDEK